MGNCAAADLCHGGPPNHWNFVVRPETSDQVSEFFRRLAVRHTMRWHAHYETGGTGHLYQGRFKSNPVQSDGHLLTMMRYVERNSVGLNFIKMAEEWHWSSTYFAASQTMNDSGWRFLTMRLCHETGVRG
ncbi:MAG: transposase [Planctomycetaceae bacterium]